MHQSDPGTRRRGVFRLANNIHSADATRISRLPWQNAGVYLLSGDAAGSGLILAGEIASSVCGARIVLTGDASASEQLEQELQALRGASLEAELEYRALDAADEAAVRECVQQIVSHYGQLNGVAHCVGAIEGERVARESDSELRRM